MTARKPGLPACARGRFDERQCFAALMTRKGVDWHETVMEIIQDDPVLRQVSHRELEDSLLEVSPAQALDLAGLISVGSLLYGPHESLYASDVERDACLQEILRCTGKGTHFFTNHGHAEDGKEADFLAASFHTNTLTSKTIDVCLVGVSDENVLVLWRFEDD
ncbi:hypothetical protein [Streptomyces tropicalis]|uniref:Uncharacterized protein n=1 Tax=Streptomyces tropicalis TaxID=3034234 RepID=A0ABT6A0M3_9ACTN|nr:hypothetical protein [Streptomyces tropicalis]MDF3298194.1 hypothetical protein [Streptomyces tropicalis]